MSALVLQFERDMYRKHACDLWEENIKLREEIAKLKSGDEKLGKRRKKHEILEEKSFTDRGNDDIN